ncbi:arylsulfatase [Vallitalea okinawensis]|uniref:arylsulfatase n=1 Tax=Vallitalea okinawensis TaxID=2078660 RepID=UPI000CFB6B05|nr:arylsulfatase [Vallitalea okinawensis]
MNPSNVLLIMTDQQRFDTLGCYGNVEIETPNLDWLASQGTVFEKAYTPSPSCIPARACLLTGMSTWSTGILGMGTGQGPMGVGFKHTLPGELSSAGYHTQGIGKMHFYPQRALNGFHNTVLDESGRVEDDNFVSDYNQWFHENKNGSYEAVDHGIGWNSWMARPYHAPEYLHPTNWTVNEALKFLNQRDPSKPFFLKVSFARPHSPYDAVPYYFNHYNNKELPEPWVGQWAEENAICTELYDEDSWRGKHKDEETHRARAGYYGNINHIDHQLGRLFRYLKSAGQLDNTMIIFTSDHGDMLGDHHLWRKTYAYEGSAHIPLLIKLPSNAKENHVPRVTQPVLLQDIMPTILSTCHLYIPDTVEGLNLLPAIRGGEIEREYIHGEHTECYSPEQEMQYLTDGKMKYIWFPRTGNEQLFNLKKDPKELYNLVTSDDNDVPKQLRIWRERMIQVFVDRNIDIGTIEGLTKWSTTIQSPHYLKRVKKSFK